MSWTQFWDMHSGGGGKEKWEKIYIEAPEEEAKIIFYNRFGHNPERVSCTCCGSDYSISESPTLEQASGFHRNCRSLVTPRGKDGLYKQPKDKWFHEHYYVEPGDEQEAENRGYKVETDRVSLGKYVPLKQYIKQPGVLVIFAKDIKPEERSGDIPQQGYVWVD